MADGIFSKFGNKIRHTFSQMGSLLGKGLKYGGAIGAVVGAGVAIWATAGAGLIPVLLWGAFGGLLGGHTGGIIGGTIGGALGTLKGFVTRPKPDGDQIIEKAVAEGTLQKPAAGVEQAPSVSQPLQTISPQAPTDLQGLTAALKESHATAPSAQAPTSWQQRMAPEGRPVKAVSWRERAAQQSQQTATPLGKV